MTPEPHVARTAWPAFSFACCQTLWQTTLVTRLQKSCLKTAKVCKGTGKNWIEEIEMCPYQGYAYSLEAMKGKNAKGRKLNSGRKKQNETGGF